jgi:hypothetical protein
MFTVSTFKVQQGTDPQMTKITLQLTQEGTAEWNTRMTPISNAEVNSELNLIDGAIETKLAFATIPTVGATVVVDVSSQCNGAAKTGLTTSSNWYVGGKPATAKTITTAVESATIPGRYTLTLSSTTVAGDLFFIGLGSAIEPVAEDILGIMYSGTSSSIQL